MATMWWNPFTVEQASLITPLSPNECIERIQQNIYHVWNARSLDGPFMGGAKGHRFLVVRNGHATNNDFRPVAIGTLYGDSGTGTLIEVRLSLHPVAWVWWPLALLFFTGFLIGSLALTLSQIGAHGFGWSEPLKVLIFTVLVGAGVYALYVMAFSFARDDREYLLSHLRKILDAPQDGEPRWITTSRRPTTASTPYCGTW